MGASLGILGAGGWGTCLALLGHRSNHQVNLWEVFPEYAVILQQRRENIYFLPGVKLPSGLRISASLKEVVTESRFLVLAVPSQHFRRTLKKLKTVYRGQPVLIATKGLEGQTGLTMSSVLNEIMGRIPFAVLSGPCIARELAQGFPSAAVVASARPEVARVFQKLLSSHLLRLYTTEDVKGVELGGAIKNVMAIGAGVIDGLQLGVNTKAAYLTRGLKEMVQLGVSLGGQEKTFYGLSGLGDLMTTAFSQHSRNRSFGQALVESSKEAFFQKTRMVVEGFFTVRSLYRLASRKKIEAPITRAVYRLVYLGKNPQAELKILMSRRLKPE